MEWPTQEEIGTKRRSGRYERMISLLITLLIYCVVAAVIWWIIGILPLPPIARTIALVIMALIFLVWLLQMVPGRL